MRTIIILTLSLIISTCVIAQKAASSAEEDMYIIKLKTGSTFEAEILEWQIDEYITVKTKWNESLVLPTSAISKVMQKSSLETIKKGKPYNFEETGLYYSGRLNLIAPNGGVRGDEKFGFGFSASAGKKYSRLVAVGAGIGYNKFLLGTGEGVLPVFVEYTSFFMPRHNSLFFNIQTGYSFAFKNEEFRITDAKGGLMVYPNIGLRYGKNDVKYTIDIGYKIQNAEFTYAADFSALRREQRLTYRRLSLRMGILL